MCVCMHGWTGDAPPEPPSNPQAASQRANQLLPSALASEHLSAGTGGDTCELSQRGAPTIASKALLTPNCQQVNA